MGLTLEGAKPTPMQKDDQGVWNLTTAPLTPDFYGYSFVADGVGLIDPSNPSLKPNLLNTTSQVHVPGPASVPWEVSDVPHGEVHHHFYKSAVVGDQRDLGYIAGFSRPEEEPDGSFRWLTEAGRVVLPLPEPLRPDSTLSLRMSGGRPGETPLGRFHPLARVRS